MSMSMAERGRLGGRVRSTAKKQAAAARVQRLGGVLSTDKKSTLLKRRWLVGSIQLGYADALLDEWCAALKQQQVLEGEKHGT